MHSVGVMYLGSIQMMRATGFNTCTEIQKGIIAFDLNAVSFICAIFCAHLYFSMSKTPSLKTTSWKTSWRYFQNILHNLERRVFLFFWPAVNFLPQ